MNTANRGGKAMARAWRLLALAALLGWLPVGAWAQQARCGVATQPGAQASSCLGSDNYLSNRRFDGTGTLAAPYVGYEFSKNWSVDASAGAARGGQTAAFGAGARFGIDRSVTAAGLSGSYWFGRGQFATRFSLLSGTEKINNPAVGVAFGPEGKNQFTQAAAMARYGYWFDGVVPYASLTRTAGSGRSVDPMFQVLARDAWTPKIGVDFFSRQGFSGGVSYSSEQGRNLVKNDLWSANLGFRF